MQMSESFLEAALERYPDEMVELIIDECTDAYEHNDEDNDRWVREYRFVDGREPHAVVITYESGEYEHKTFGSYASAHVHFTEVVDKWAAEREEDDEAADEDDEDDDLDDLLDDDDAE